MASKLVRSGTISADKAVSPGLIPPPPAPYIPPKAPMPTVTFSYSGSKLSVILNCDLQAATIYYRYCIGGTTRSPSFDASPHVVPGTTIEIDDTSKGGAINIWAYASAQVM